MEKTKHKRSAVFWLCIALVLCLISAIGASLLQTDFGNVQIIKFKIPTDNGKWLSGNLFRPVSATAENKVPIVITSHGYLNNNQMQDISAIELSRRGIAVIAMDAYFHGDSSSSSASYQDSGVIEGMGMIPLVEFAYSQLDLVDNTKIGVMGHPWAAAIHGTRPAIMAGFICRPWKMRRRRIPTVGKQSRRKSRHMPIL